MTTKTQIKDRLIVALDTSSEQEAIKLIEKLSDCVSYFKVGLELYTSIGPKIFNIIKDKGNKVFFDGKFIDIPNQVKGAVANMVHHRVDMLTLHMAGGLQMLREAKNSANESAQKHNLQPPKILGVSVLTSITGDALQNDLKVQSQIDEYVLHLAMLAFKNNLDGIVCSPQEAKLIREATDKNFLIVTPGVRPSWSKTHDQKRIATPKDAISNGASHIVVGRPITEASNPLDAAKKILDEMESAI